ncbi:hypothetical protein [Erwinia persicina]|uniref:hypothetical protein n=1 Tax=Erwinia persicina TaxID=55211 RepID=UPI001C3F1A2C|nr:hypothetical protein [Erwinia persicina]
MAQSGLLNKAFKAAVLKRFGHVHCHSARLTLINNLCNRHGDVYPTEEGYSGEYEKKDGHGGGLRSRLRGAEVASVTQYSTGECLVLQDGYPIPGFTDERESVYVAVMHPAVTCAAAIGRRGSEELRSGKNDEIPESYRFSCFTASGTSQTLAEFSK